MPSEPALSPLLKPSADAFRSALASAVESLRGLLAATGRGEDEVLERETAALGGFAVGRVDMQRFVAVTAAVRDLAPGVASVPVLERAYDALHHLSEAGYEPFRVVVEPDESLHDAVAEALARVGRAFGAARVAALVRAGTWDAARHERLLERFDQRRWNATERRVAPPLEVEVDGADLHVAGLSEFLDGRQRLLLRVRGACPPAALARLLSRHTYVQQAASEDALAGFTAWQGPAVAALVPDGCARFVHDPAHGGSIGERLRVDFLPEDASVKPLGAWSREQQLEDLDHLRELAAAAPPPPAADAAPEGTSADRLAAFLLSRAALDDA